MDDSKVQELRLIHHDLAKVISAQQEVIATLRLVVAAIQKTLANDPDLSEKYGAFLGDQISPAFPQPNPTQARLVAALVTRLDEW